MRARLLRLALAVTLAAASGCEPGSPLFTVDDYVLVSFQRITRTEFEYTYAATCRNHSLRDAVAATAVVSSGDASTVVVEAELDCGAIPSLAAARSADTFTIRQDRGFAFDPGALEWQVDARTPSGLRIVAEDAPAAEAIPRVDTQDVVGADEVSTSGRLVIARTRLEIGFADGTSFAQAADLLDARGARVISALEGFPAVVVRVPDPGSLEALAELVAALRAEPSVDGVSRARQLQPFELPPQYELEDEPFRTDFAYQFLRHLLPHRAPAAWNARALALFPPTVVIVDYFGDGPPDGDFGVQVLEPGEYVFGARAEVDPESLETTLNATLVLGQCTLPPP